MEVLLDYLKMEIGNVEIVIILISLGDLDVINVNRRKVKTVQIIIKIQVTDIKEEGLEVHRLLDQVVVKVAVLVLENIERVKVRNLNQKERFMKMITV